MNLPLTLAIGSIGRYILCFIPSDGKKYMSKYKSESTKSTEIIPNPYRRCWWNHAACDSKRSILQRIMGDEIQAGGYKEFGIPFGFRRNEDRAIHEDASYI